MLGAFWKWPSEESALFVNAESRGSDAARVRRRVRSMNDGCMLNFVDEMGIERCQVCLSPDSVVLTIVKAV